MARTYCTIGARLTLIISSLIEASSNLTGSFLMGTLELDTLFSIRPNKVKNMFLVLLPDHFCEVVMVTFLFTACCYSYTV